MALDPITVFSTCLLFSCLLSQAFLGPRHPRPDHQPQSGRGGLTVAASSAQRRGDSSLGCGQPQDVVGAEDGGGERDVLARYRQARRPVIARDATGIVAVELMHHWIIVALVRIKCPLILAN